MNRTTWITAELFTIVLGSYIATFNFFNHRSAPIGLALGIALVVLGIMIRLWRKEFSNSKINN